MATAWGAQAYGGRRCAAGGAPAGHSAPWHLRFHAGADCTMAGLGRKWPCEKVGPILELHSSRSWRRVKF